MGGTDLPDFKAHRLQKVCCGDKKWTWGTAVTVFPPVKVSGRPELTPTHRTAESQELGVRVYVLTPHVVITGSLNTLQQSWQQSFTEGCSANTNGS